MHSKEGHEARGAGERRTKQWVRDIRRSVEGRGMGRGTRDIQHGHYRDFQEGIREFEGGGFGVD